MHGHAILLTADDCRPRPSDDHSILITLKIQNHITLHLIHFFIFRIVHSALCNDIVQHQYRWIKRWLGNSRWGHVIQIFLISRRVVPWSPGAAVCLLVLALGWLIRAWRADSSIYRPLSIYKYMAYRFATVRLYIRASFVNQYIYGQWIF